ncbi:MAG: extracellular solute-binding protein [Actinobacteria bacterium]|nr:extracellular solute-binding protein [Actinomycetota bacterium]
MSNGISDRGDGKPDPGARGLSRRQFIGRSAGVALALGGAGGVISACGGGGADEVVVVNWAGDYLSPVFSEILKEETGLTMKAVPSENDQAMFTKVKAGGGGQYDIVFANCGWAPTYYKNGLTEAFDVDEIKNGHQIWPIFREDTSLPYVLEPNRLTLFPNMWDALTMMWNTEVSYQPRAPYRWKDLWSSEVPSGKVLFKGSSETFLAIAGLSLGVPKDKIYEMDGSQLEEVAQHLAELKPFQIANTDTLFAQAFESQKAWIGQSVSQAAESQINKEAGKNVVEAQIPTEGSLGWIDGPQIVKGTKHRENAIKFIETWNGQRWQSWLFNKLGYAQCNEVSTKRVLAEGGEAAETVRNHGGAEPDRATQLLFEGPPKNPAAWTEAYDEVVAA